MKVVVYEYELKLYINFLYNIALYSKRSVTSIIAVFLAPEFYGYFLYYYKSAGFIKPFVHLKSVF